MGPPKDLPPEDQAYALWAASGERCNHCHRPLSTCRSCGARILWATSTSGKPYPLDAKTTTIARPLEPEGPSAFWETIIGHVPHHVTCPQAREWKGRYAPAKRLGVPRSQNP